MDIERMHTMIEKLTENALAQFDNGIENVDTCEMAEVVDMMKDLSEAMYYRTLTKAMDSSDTEEVLTMLDRFGDRRYYEPRYHIDPHDRDIDREKYERMYYTEPKTKVEVIEKESDYDKAKHYYTETKAVHSGTSTEDKDKKMKALEKYMQELGLDISELVNGMTEEEKNMLRTKMSTLITKI